MIAAADCRERATRSAAASLRGRAATTSRGGSSGSRVRTRRLLVDAVLEAVLVRVAVVVEVVELGDIVVPLGGAEICAGTATNDERHGPGGPCLCWLAVRVGAEVYAAPTAGCTSTSCP